MKKITALYGRSNTGKTTTLNYLIGFLDENLEIDDNSLTNNRKEVIYYKNKKIAVTTPGDNKSELKKNIEYFKNKDCDILVTATRTKGATREELKKYAQDIKTEIIWIKKEISETSATLINKKQAKDIQAIIDKL